MDNRQRDCLLVIIMMAFCLFAGALIGHSEPHQIEVTSMSGDHIVEKEVFDISEGKIGIAANSQYVNETCIDWYIIKRV